MVDMGTDGARLENKETKDVFNIIRYTIIHL